MSDERTDPGEDELLLDEPETDVEEFDGEIEDLADEEPDEDNGGDADEPVVEEPRPRRRADVVAELEATRQQHRQAVANQIVSQIPQRVEAKRQEIQRFVEMDWDQQDRYLKQQAENEARFELFKIQDAADQEAFRKYRASKGLSKLHGNQVDAFLVQARQQGYWNLTRRDASIYLRGLQADGGARVASGRTASRRSNGRGKLTRSDMALLSRARVKDVW